MAATLILNAHADRSMTEILSKVQQVKYRLLQDAADPIGVFKLSRALEFRTKHAAEPACPNSRE